MPQFDPTHCLLRFRFARAELHVQGVDAALPGQTDRRTKPLARSLGEIEGLRLALIEPPRDVLDLALVQRRSRDGDQQGNVRIPHQELAALILLSDNRLRRVNLQLELRLWD